MFTPDLLLSQSFVLKKGNFIFLVAQAKYLSVILVLFSYIPKISKSCQLCLKRIAKL